MQGEAGELSTSAPSLQDLDLSSNLLSRWQDVDALCTELPRLHTLNLSYNFLRLSDVPPSNQFPNMRRLVLNHCSAAFYKVCSHHT